MSSPILITHEDCKQIIMKTKWKEYTYSSSELIPFTEGRSGTLGEHYKLKIKFQETPEEPKFFIKCIPSRHCINRKEAGYYGRILPEFLKYRIEEIKSILPQCYLIKNPDYIVLEDLTMQGFKTICPQTPLDKHYVLSVLETLAIYHAASIIYEVKKKEEVGNAFDLQQCFTEELQEIYYRNYTVEKDVLQSTRNTIASQVTLFEDIVCKQKSKNNLVSSLISLWDTIKNYVAPSKEYKNVICHGDLWQANLMFLVKNGILEKCVLIDEQMIRYGPPAQDVMSFLYLTTDRKLRQDHLGSLLDSYYNSLQKLLYAYKVDYESIIPREEFLRSCDVYKPFAMLQAFSYAHITHIPTELFEEFMGQEDEKVRFLFETRAPAMEMFCKEDQVYRTKQLECLIDLVEYIENRESAT